MDDPHDSAPPAAGSERPLASAIRSARNAAADREDVAIELREAQRARIELLAQELQPVFGEIPSDDERFDCVLSSGLRPRLWIDAVAHVSLGRDNRTYRFLLDTRLGRKVIAESASATAVAAHVTRYIAERIVERQRALEDGCETFRTAFAPQPAATPSGADGPPDPEATASASADPGLGARSGEAAAAASDGAAERPDGDGATAGAGAQEAAGAAIVGGPPPYRRGWQTFIISLLLVIAGALLGFAIGIAVFWDRLASVLIRL